MHSINAQFVKVQNPSYSWDGYGVHFRNGIITF
nr:MAG TPA: hypothetical protein [Caudoviricetes sp.]